MKLISARPVFTISNPKTTLFNIFHFSTSTPSFNPSPNSTYHSRRQEEESRNVRVSVWWDFENCNLPGNVNVFRVSQFITSAVRANGIKGPIQITAFGDIMQLSRVNQEALSATGINLNHIPSGGKNSADRSLLVDLMYWVSQNPPPAHLFLISGDRDFAGILHRLRMKNYNILLASPDGTPSVLCSAASIMWPWNSLVMGENLNGKHFNKPPDGPHGSWYGHPNALLEDPFAVTEQPCGSHTDELSNSGSDSKLRPIPKAVIRQIRHILKLHPQGILVTELRRELMKSNLITDKDLYGYKKFFRFFSAMPHILKLQSGSDGQIYVRGVNIKVSEQDESTPSIYTGPVSNTEGSETISPLTNTEATTEAHPKNLLEPSNMNEKKMKMQQLPGKGEESLQPMQEVPKKQDRIEPNATENKDSSKKVEVPSSPIAVLDNATENKNELNASEEKSSVAEVGFLRRIWRKCFGSREGDVDKKNDEISAVKATVEGKDLITISSSDKLVYPALFSPSSHEAISDGKLAFNSDAIVEPSSERPSIVSRFWSTRESDAISDANQIKIDNQKKDIFAEESFWKEIETFMETSQASALVSQSKTRAQLAQNLQNKGPPALRSLSLSDAEYVVDLLIVDKKWVEKSGFVTCPFKLVHPSRNEDPSNNLPNRHPQSTSQNPQQLVDVKHANTRPRVSQSKSRSEILADCEKLVDHVLKEYPEGYNMGGFKKLFQEKYGYSLDLQKLGYQKLVTLFHIMPGVRIESTFIVPAGENVDPKSGIQEGNFDYLGTGLSNSVRRDEDPYSAWEELGPIANMGPTKDEKVGSTKGHHDYEPLAEDDFSDSEDEASSDGGDNSRLIQTLESWSSSKDGGDNSRLIQTLESWNSSKDERENATRKPTLNHARRQKSTKSYSFVSEQPRDNKDILDGIINSFKKSSEKSAEPKVLS